MKETTLLKMIKNAEICDKLGFYHVADQIVNEVFYRYAKKPTSNFINYVKNSLLNGDEIKESIAQSLTNATSNLIDSIGSSNINTIIQQVESIGQTARNTKKQLLQQALITKIQNGTQSEGMLLSPGARGTGQGGAAGKDTTQSKQQIVNQEKLNALDTLTMIEGIGISLKNFKDTVNAITKRINKAADPDSVQGSGETINI